MDFIRHKFLLFFYFVILFFIGNQPLFADSNNGLILYYSFDSDEGNIVSDESGENNDGVVHGAQYVADGKLGGAYHFDGINDYILGGDLGYVEQGTIMFWLKADVVENWRNPFSGDYASWDDCICFEESSTGEFCIGALGLGTGIYDSSLQPNKWYHIVYSWDENTSAPNRYWKGLVDEVRIYNRVLSAEEIQAFNAVEKVERIYQDFEPDNGSDGYGWGFNGVSVSLSNEEVHSGSQAWKVETIVNEGGTGIQSQKQRWDMDFRPDKNDRLTFWTYAIPSQGNDNNVAVEFFNQGEYKTNGFKIWTTKAARFQQWTKLTVLFSQLPDNFDLHHVDKITFVNYWPGTYYFDDIHVTLDDRIYQAFERYSNAEECGWAWGGTVELEEEFVHEGEYSWRLQTTENWGGTGIKSQEKKYESPDSQTFWHVDLNPTHNDRLTFWVYSLAENGMDNNINVQFFDHDNHFYDPVIAWTTKPAVYGQWTKLTVLFNELPDTLNLSDINKIQLQVYWPGMYYFDDIRATQQWPHIDKAVLSLGTVQWEPIDGAALYELQENIDGPDDGHWQTIYEGAHNTFQINNLSESWLRVRWKEFEMDTPHVGYVSDWSNWVHYMPPPVLIKNSCLKEGNIKWNFIPQAEEYEVEEAQNKSGPWTQIYKGEHTILEQQALINQWYRVRAVRGPSGEIVAATTWSPALSYTPNKYVCSVGTVLKEFNGEGNTLTLRGINIGNFLLIEPEFVGIGGLFTPDNIYDDDDFHIRAELTERFGTDDLLLNYQNAYIQESDLNNIMRVGANFIRLPIYYKALQDENGQFTNFQKIDWIVNACADRGIYVLLDLHGAPGAQSNEGHTGRKNYNMLFENSSEGNSYRNQTIELWQSIAAHYKNNTTIVGFDLLNEPFGANDHGPNYTAVNGLWTFYDSLYQAIREIDNHHLIVIEGIPSAFDWDTLPHPDQYGWQNVMYQFHYYGFTFDDQGYINGSINFDGHKILINDKIANSQQDEYQVPVMIGEFNGFSLRPVWNYYFQTFSEQNWSWAMWSYKSHPNLSDWGLYIHHNYDESPVNVSIDSEAVLMRKFSKYDTDVHHEANQTLIHLLSAAFKHLYEANQTSDKVTSKWYTINFKQTFDVQPVLLANIETFDGSNTASLRIRDLDENGFVVKIEEEQSRDKEVWHTTEVVGYAAFAPGTIKNADGKIIGEAGIVKSNQKNGNQWHTLILDHSYTDPVVFMQLVSFNGGQPAHIRLRNINKSSFQYQIEEWDYLDQSHTTEAIAFVVLEQGIHQLGNGIKMEAGTVDANHNWTDVTLNQVALSAPVVISHTQTRNGSQAVVTRQKNINESGFKIRLQEEEANDGWHYIEKIGYLVIESGQ